MNTFERCVEFVCLSRCDPVACCTLATGGGTCSERTASWRASPTRALCAGPTAACSSSSETRWDAPSEKHFLRFLVSSPMAQWVEQRFRSPGARFRTLCLYQEGIVMADGLLFATMPNEAASIGKHGLTNCGTGRRVAGLFSWLFFAKLVAYPPRWQTRARGAVSYVIQIIEDRFTNDCTRPGRSLCAGHLPCVRTAIDNPTTMKHIRSRLDGSAMHLTVKKHVSCDCL